MNSLIKREFDYAIRICAYLAGKMGQGPVPISQISQKLLQSFKNKMIKNFVILESDLIQDLRLALKT
jgi:hypothetical protein